jgi:hypothetical protein
LTECERVSVIDKPLHALRLDLASVMLSTNMTTHQTNPMTHDRVDGSLVNPVVDQRGERGSKRREGDADRLAPSLRKAASTPAAPW